MEDDIDIYEDLPNFETENDENFVGNKEKDTTGGEQVELEKRIIELTTKVEDFQKVNENLKMNLISLLKTAKAEIARKDTVIDDLRRKLENAAFRRGVYSKTNRGIAQDSTVRNNAINKYLLPSDPGLSFKENEHEAPTWNSWHHRVKEQQRESTVTSITVFGERLRKRMMDEQHLEKEDNNSESIVTATTTTTTTTTTATSTTAATINTATATTITTNNSSGSSSGPSSNNNNNNNYNDNDNNNNNNNSNSNSSISSNNKEGTEKYIGESDKENGSFINKNYCNGKSVEPGTIVRYTNSGCSKSAITISRSRTNSELEDKGETVEKSKGTSVIGMKGIGKRTREETRVSDLVKRRKLEEGKRSMESTRKESKRNVSELSEKMGDASEYASSVIESSDTIKEKRHILKIWDTGYVSGNDSTRKAKKQEKEERRGSKMESEASHGKSVTNGRIEMRRNESGEKFVLDLDERNASDRCLEILKKYNRRSNVEHRRVKEREDRYAACGVDHRSMSFRSREAASYARCQEGKYGANERARHTGYGDKFGKCHDYRGIGTDKSKTIHEQSYGPRDTKELSSLDRISIDRKTNGSKQINRYVGYERRRSRGSTDGIGKQERGRENECNEQDPRRRIKTERSSRERVNEREIWRRSDKKSDRCVVGRIERIDDTDNERIKYRKKSNDRLSDLEEGELENSQERNDKRKRCVNRENREVIEEPSDPSNVCSSRPMERDGQIKMEKNDSGRLQVNESVENLENIEKFIRELASDDLNRERTRVTASETKTKTNTETETETETEMETIGSKQPNLDEKMLVTSEQDIEKKLGIDDDDGVRNYVAEKHEKKEKQESSASKIVCSNIIESENILGNECFAKQETRLEVDKVSSNRLRLNIVDSTNNIQAANGTTEGTSLPRAGTDRSLENIAEDDLLLVLSNESPNSRFSIDPLKSSGKPTIDEDKNTIDIGHSNGIRDNDIEQRIDRNDYVNRVNTETKGKEEKERTEVSKEPINLPSRRRENSSANSKLATLNIHGNVVVFVRRKKPVCLADNTANMTVIVNDKKHECNKPVDSSDRVSGNDATLRRNSVLQTPTPETADG